MLCLRGGEADVFVSLLCVPACSSKLIDCLPSMVAARVYQVFLLLSPRCGFVSIVSPQSVMVYQFRLGKLVHMDLVKDFSEVFHW